MANMSVEDILRMVRGKPAAKVAQSPKLPSEQAQEVILQALQAAFDEGIESPYELRASATKKILAEFMPKLEGLQEDSKKCPMPSKARRQELAQMISQTIPPNILRYMLKARCFFAGGALISHLLNGGWSKASDFDLFIHKADLGYLDLKLTKSSNSKKAYSSAVAKIDQVYVMEPQIGHFAPIPINVISGDFTKPSDVVKSFDLRFLQVCMFATAERTFEVEFYSHDSWDDLLAAEIHLTETALDSKSKTKTKERIKKYIARGFADRTGLVDKGPLTRLVKSMLEAKCK